MRTLLDSFYAHEGFVLMNRRSNTLKYRCSSSAWSCCGTSVDTPLILLVDLRRFRGFAVKERGSVGNIRSARAPS